MVLVDHYVYHVWKTCGWTGLDDNGSAIKSSPSYRLLTLKMFQETPLKRFFTISAHGLYGTWALGNNCVFTACLAPTPQVWRERIGYQDLTNADRVLNQNKGNFRPIDTNYTVRIYQKIRKTTSVWTIQELKVHFISRFFSVFPPQDGLPLVQWSLFKGLWLSPNGHLSYIYQT